MCARVLGSVSSMKLTDVPTQQSLGGEALPTGSTFVRGLLLVVRVMNPDHVDRESTSFSVPVSTGGASIFA